MKPLLIIGCGRSGFAYTAAVLQAIGLDVRHEHMGDHGMASWAATFEDEVVHDDFLIVHQVRHPLRAIASIATFTKSSWDYAIQKEPQIASGDEALLRPMKYWYYWNLLAEARAELTYRVESIDPGDMIGVPKDTNNRPHRALDWRDLAMAAERLHDNIQEMAQRYGYSTVNGQV